MDSDTSDSPSQLAAHAAEILHQTYGSPRHGNKDDPLDELVFIVLSQMTTHHSFNRVFDRLKESFPSWDDLLNSGLLKLTEIIKDAGLSNQKAPRIWSILERIRADFGRVSLEPLREMPDDEAEHYLTSLPGVGIKTAKCVLMYSLGRAVLPVDTHVWRVARRLCLLDPDLPYPRVHEALERVVPPAARYSFHVNAIPHGRQVCIAKRPRCSGCSLVEFCPYPKSERASQH